MSKSGVSVIIITHNIVDKIERCLLSIKDLSDDIIIIDSFSDDGTFKVCKKYTSKAYQQEWQGYAKQKNIALAKANNDWIFWIDSDEELLSDAQEKIRQIINRNADVVGYKIKRRTKFLGRWVDHCFGNDYVLRLFKKDENVYFPEDVSLHEYLNITGKIETLKEVFINHYPYKNLDEYFEKFIRYADLFAKNAIKKGRKNVGFLKLVSAFPLTFVKLYILKMGFLDGWQGFSICVLSAMHNFVKYARLWELQRNCEELEDD